MVLLYSVYQTPSYGNFSKNHGSKVVYGSYDGAWHTEHNCIIGARCSLVSLMEEVMGSASLVAILNIRRCKMTFSMRQDYMTKYTQMPVFPNHIINPGHELCLFVSLPVGNQHRLTEGSACGEEYSGDCPYGSSCDPITSVCLCDDGLRPHPDKTHCQKGLYGEKCSKTMPCQGKLHDA